MAESVETKLEDFLAGAYFCLQALTFLVLERYRVELPNKSALNQHNLLHHEQIFRVHFLAQQLALNLCWLNLAILNYDVVELPLQTMQTSSQHQNLFSVQTLF